MDEKIVEQAVTNELYNLPWNVWLFIVSGIGGVVWKCIRLFFRVGALEKQTEAIAKQNTKQDELFKELFQLNNKTNVVVGQIQGMLGNRKTDTQE